jgi:hypothetical protein
VQRKAGVWANRTVAQLGADLASGFTTYTPELRTGATSSDGALSSAYALGTGGGIAGRYLQIGKLLFVYVEVNWGTSADALAAGAPVVVTAPAGFTAASPVSPSGDYHIGAGLVGQIVGVRDRPVTVYTLGGSTWTFRFVAGTSQNVGTATVDSGTVSETVTHTLGVTPSRVMVTPTSSWATSGMARFWTSSVGATTFVINATTSAAGNLTGNQTFDWLAINHGTGILTQGNPFGGTGGGLGINGDHLHFWAMVPLA